LLQTRKRRAQVHEERTIKDIRNFSQMIKIPLEEAGEDGEDEGNRAPYVLS
jgi:hypothetical protein